MNKPSPTWIILTLGLFSHIQNQFECATNNPARITLTDTIDPLSEFETSHLLNACFRFFSKVDWMFLFFSSVTIKKMKKSHIWVINLESYKFTLCLDRSNIQIRLQNVQILHKKRKTKKSQSNIFPPGEMSITVALNGFMNTYRTLSNSGKEKLTNRPPRMHKIWRMKKN